MTRADASRARLRADLVDQLPDIVVEFETDGRISTISRAVGRIFWIDPERILGRSFLEFVTSEDRDRTIAGFRKVVETGEDLTIRFQVTRRDGLRIAIEGSFRAFTRMNGRRAIAAVCRDVTHHESSNRVDRLREAHYRSVVESGLSATAIARAEGSIQFANRRFKALFGELEHIDGIAPLMRFGQRKALADAWFESTQENASNAGAMDLELIDTSAESRWVALYWNGFESESGERLFAVHASDITRRKQVEFAFTRLARGVDLEDGDSLRSLLAALATALGLDRLVLARLDPTRPDLTIRIGGWQDGRDLGVGEDSLVGLPEASAVRGEICIHPAGVTRLLPDVADRLDPGFVSFAGIGLTSDQAGDRNRRVIGLLAGYARRPLSDPERVRGLLTSAAIPLARALEAQRQRAVEASVRATTGDDGPARWLSVAREARPGAASDSGRDLLHRVIHQSADLVFVCDLDTTLLFANETASRHLGTALPDPVSGHSLFDLLTPDDAERLRSEVLPRLTPSFPWSGELMLQAGRERSPIPTEATILLFCDPAGPADSPALRSYFAVTLRDISARRRTEEALRQSELRLSQARKLESVGRLAGGIAHDFNNLLTAIIGYGDLVLQDLDTDHPTRPDIEEILRAAERASGLTRQLLAFSRRQVLRPARVDLNSVVAEIDRMLRRLIGEDIELVSRLDGGLDAILADPGQVEQVIVNLVVNARDAMPRGGRIELETFNHRVRRLQRVESGVLAPGAYVALRVRDTGIGMDEATRSQIFEPFFTTKSASGGTGLGLASVYGIVSQSRGQIDVTSHIGEGSSFTVYLPTAREALVESKPDEPLVDGRGRETVLLVEDSKPVRKLVERTLHRRGYTVLTAESATAALRHCSRHDGPIDLILTDVVLPRMGGPEVARRAQQLRPGIRVLFMSGFTDEALTQHGLPASGDLDLLEKPFSSAVLLARVRQALDAQPMTSSETAFPVEQSLLDQAVED